MSHRGSNYNRGRHGGSGYGKRKFKSEDVVLDSPLLKKFSEYARELDDKHDRYERIVKISRDITIESKRIIFLLHTIDSKKGNAEKVLCEAEQRLQSIFSQKFFQIAKELFNMDAYQYSKAYSAGLQEFIEALSYFEFLSNKHLSDWEAIQNRMIFDSKVDDNNEENEEKEDEEMSTSLKVTCLVQPIEYMLGLADVTGELMRRSINSLGTGDIDGCFQLCRLLQSFYTGYMSLEAFRHRDLSRKIATLRQSVLKSEQVCYNIKVRGSEAALLGASDQASYLSFVNEDRDKIDEGFYD